jgi:hypothetical protein
MIRLINLFSSITMLFLLLPVNALAELSLKLWIEPNNRAVQCEPRFLNIRWENTGTEDVFVGLERRPAHSKAVSIIVDREIVKKPILEAIEEWLPQAPSTLKQKENITDILDLHMIPLESGKHEIKAVADFSKINNEIRMKPVESNVIDFIIEKPEGNDLHAFAFADERVPLVAEDHLDPENARCAELLLPAILRLFPESIYAAWIVVRTMPDPKDLEPAMLDQLIDQGRYPTGNSVPSGNSIDGWESQSEGVPMATWQNNWIKVILKNHPDFPTAERLRLTLAVNYIVLKNETEAFKLLREAAAKPTSKEGAWARSFLLLQK